MTLVFYSNYQNRYKVPIQQAIEEWKMFLWFCFENWKKKKCIVLIIRTKKRQRRIHLLWSCCMMVNKEQVFWSRSCSIIDPKVLRGLYALDVPSEKCAMDWRNVHCFYYASSASSASASSPAHKLNLLCTWWKLFPSFLPNEKTSTSLALHCSSS